MDYYRRFPGDYARDTRHLSLEQHGAYTLLLDHCYSTESAILSVEAALKICAAMTKRERNSVKFALEHFFELTADGYRHSRVEKEINYANSISSVRRRAAEVKHQKHANAQQMQVQMPAIPDNQTTRQPEEDRTNTRRRVFSTPEFERFWQAYPEKLNQADALRAWHRVPFADKSIETIIAGLEVWKLSERWQQGYILSAVRFLNNRSWEEIPPPKPLTKNQQARTKTNEAIERIKQRGNSGMGTAVGDALRSYS